MTEYLNKLVKWAILLVFVFIFTAVLFAKSGLLPKTKNVVLAMERFLPYEPNKEVKQDGSLPNEVKTAQINFINSLNNNKDKEKCLLRFQGLDGLDGFIMEISNYKGAIQSSIFKPVGKEGGRKLNTQKSEEGLKFCIASSSDFLNCYYNNNKESCSKIMYNTIGPFELTADSIKINGNTFGFMRNFFYKADKETICIFPSTDEPIGCDSGFSAPDYCFDKINSKISYC